MRKVALMLLPLILALSFSLPVAAQEKMPAGAGEQEDMDSGTACKCDKCGMHGMKGGMMGMKGMPGSIDRMTWPPMDKSCCTPEFYMTNMEELGLSSYQMEALKKLDSAVRKEMILRGASVKVLEMELSDIVTKMDFKLDDALAKLSEVEKARTLLRSAVLKASSDARDVLSQEQKDKLREMDMSGSMCACGRLKSPGKEPMKEEMKQKMMEKMRREMMQ